jgi:hypothetical protein
MRTLHQSETELGFSSRHQGLENDGQSSTQGLVSLVMQQLLAGNLEGVAIEVAAGVAYHRRTLMRQDEICSKISYTYIRRAPVGDRSALDRKPYPAHLAGFARQDDRGGRRFLGQCAVPEGAACGSSGNKISTISVPRGSASAALRPRADDETKSMALNLYGKPCMRRWKRTASNCGACRCRPNIPTIRVRDSRSGKTKSPTARTW